jgi:hypothetical protein
MSGSGAEAVEQLYDAPGIGQLPMSMKQLGQADSRDAKWYAVWSAFLYR